MEFEQTYHFVVTQIPKTCTSFQVSKDALQDGIYHFFSYWISFESLYDFSQSSAFIMLVGSFMTLGRLDRNIFGEMIEFSVDQEQRHGLENDPLKIPW